jgi:hypothetical protein
MVAKPQITTPASKIDHSDGLSAQTLPSDTTKASTEDIFCIFASTPSNSNFFSQN